LETGRGEKKRNPAKPSNKAITIAIASFTAAFPLLQAVH